MEMILFRRNVYEHRYNCSLYSVDEIPLAARQHPLLGISIVVVSLAFSIMYVASILVMARYLQRPSYKIMFYIGFTDVGMLAIVAASYGILSIRGSVFCSDRDWIYIHGCLSMGFWKSSSESSVLLALNRCLEMLNPPLAAALLKGNRTLVWLLLSMAHFVVAVAFATPVLWTPLYTTMMFNPHVGYQPAEHFKYYDKTHQPHDAFVFFGIVVLYTAFVVTIAVKRRFGRAAAVANRLEWKTFFQVLLICSCSATASGMYLVIPIMPELPPIAIPIGTYTRIFSHGMPAVIYLTINQSMRQDLKKLVGLKPCNTTVNPTSVRLDATVVTDGHALPAESAQ